VAHFVWKTKVLYNCRAEFILFRELLDQIMLIDGCCFSVRYTAESMVYFWSRGAHKQNLSQSVLKTWNPCKECNDRTRSKNDSSNATKWMGIMVFYKVSTMIVRVQYKMWVTVRRALLYSMSGKTLVRLLYDMI
jgi:hypothetical protein